MIEALKDDKLSFIDIHLMNKQKKMSSSLSFLPSTPQRFHLSASIPFVPPIAISLHSPINTCSSTSNGFNVFKSVLIVTKLKKFYKYHSNINLFIWVTKSWDVFLDRFFKNAYQARRETPISSWTLVLYGSRTSDDVAPKDLYLVALVLDGRNVSVWSSKNGDNSYLL